MKNILSSVITFSKTYKKRIITIITSGVLAIIIIVGIVGGVVYSNAKSNSKYTEEQLQEIALAKIPGEVVDVEKELNFRKQSYQYEFKIKDKDNMLQEIKLDSKYGVILGENDGKHKKENKFEHGRKDGENKEGRMHKNSL